MYSEVVGNHIYLYKTLVHTIQKLKLKTKYKFHT